jgi:hypothetical protein
MTMTSRPTGCMVSGHSTHSERGLHFCSSYIGVLPHSEALRWADPHSENSSEMSKIFTVLEINSESEQAK